MADNKVTPVEEDKEDNVLPFSKPLLKVAGKEPPADNWIWKLDPGTIFLVSLRHQFSVVLPEYKLIIKSDKAVYVQEGTKEGLTYWVDPAMFCNKFSLYEILGKDDD